MIDRACVFSSPGSFLVIAAAGTPPPEYRPLRKL
jgi:hypothetical protein